MKKFAMIFPGQGSQFVGMLSELAGEFSVVKHTFQQASDVLDYDLWHLVQQGTAEELNKTWRTQPALLSASVAIFRIWQQIYANFSPNIMAGHSLGEYSALVCSDSLDFQDAVKLVELRGKLMQEAVPEGSGAMYAIIGLDNNDIIEICSQSEQGEVVSAVNFNSPGQVVIAGNKNAVERAAQACKKAGAKRVMPLSVSVPSHCILMKSAAEKFAISLANVVLKQPKIDIVNNVDVKLYTDENNIRDSLVRQLYNPVRWVESVEKIAASGANILIEIGPNKVLTGLVKRIDNSLQSYAVNDVNSLNLIKEHLS